MKIPLSAMYEEARRRVSAACAKTAEETHLPAYLMDGILSGILAEMRGRAILEIAADLEAMNAKDNQEEQKRHDHDESSNAAGN